MDLWPSIRFTCCIDFVLWYSRRALQYRNVWQWIFRNLGLLVTLAKFFIRKRKLPCLVFGAAFGNTVFSFFGKLSSMDINCIEMVIIRAFPFFDALIVTLFLFGSRSVHSSLWAKPYISHNCLLLLRQSLGALSIAVPWRLTYSSSVRSRIALINPPIDQ